MCWQHIHTQSCCSHGVKRVHHKGAHDPVLVEERAAIVAVRSQGVLHGHRALVTASLDAYVVASHREALGVGYHSCPARGDPASCGASGGGYF